MNTIINEIEETIEMGKLLKAKIELLLTLNQKENNELNARLKDVNSDIELAEQVLVIAKIIEA